VRKADPAVASRLHRRHHGPEPSCRGWATGGKLEGIRSEGRVVTEVLDRPEARDAPPPDDEPPHRPRAAWLTAVTMAGVLGCAAALLLTGHPLGDAMAGAAGMALVGGQVARRVIADAGPLPTVIVVLAVAVFGAILIILGYGLPQSAMGAGMAGLVAGEVAGRLPGTGNSSGREV
jgi:uncharacterized membrane protein (UPF0136 family)